jgi:AcrR family transcriptional regulator
MKSTERQSPKQERSRRRYDHILQVAAQLFEAQGIEAVSTNHIAAEAGISIGSLYQFFPNKEAIIEALIERFLTEIDAVFPEQIDASIPVDVLSREIIVRFTRFEAQKIGFAAVFSGEDERLHGRLIDGIQRILAAYYPSLAAEKCRLCASITLGITKGLMPLPLPNDLLINEIHRAVVAYQAAFLQSESLS